jgi:hypothetical protein
VLAQHALTIRAFLRDGHRSQVDALLERMRHDGSMLPFDELPGVHFARVFVLDAERDANGAVIPASLVLMADVDGSLHQRLTELATTAAAGVDELFGHCAGYPDQPSVRARAAWLRAHAVRAAAYYVHTAGRTVEQARAESRLRAEIGDYLDKPGALDGAPTSAAARERIREMVIGRPDLAWAGAPPAGRSLPARLREKVHLIGVPLLAIAAAPVLVPLTVVVLIVLRRQERRDVPETAHADPARVEEIERFEDFGAQNPFTAVGFVKPGLARRVALRTVVFWLSYAVRHAYAKDNLAGVRTIHFARWVYLDGGRRLVFASSYDGSLESYMDDFIDRLAWGLNAVFSNGVGYPTTRWLLFGGAHDEPAFKNYLRRHQVPATVFYSAYDTVTARNLDDNTRLRRGLAADAAGSDAAGWASLL